MTTIAEQLAQQQQNSSSLHAVDRLLRDGPGTLQRIHQGRDLSAMAQAMITTIAVGGGLFGAAMGSFRGEVQIVFAAIKLPMAMLLTTAICAAALTTVNAALGRPASIRRDLAVVLCALARASLVLAAEAPIVLLAVRLGVGYHRLILLVVACCALAGLVGLSLFVRGLRGAAERAVWSTALALLVVFGLVGTQMAWTLRPFVLRPRTPTVPFVRSVEGSFIESVINSSRSARGIYFRAAAPLPEEEHTP